MRNSFKIWLIVAASAVLLGIIIFGGAMSFLNWDFKKLSTEKYQTNTHEISDKFESISIDTHTGGVTFMKSEDEKCRVVCYEEEKRSHRVTVEDGTLSIVRVNTRKWYDYIHIFSFEIPQVTVYLPESEYSALTIDVSTAAVEIASDFTFDSISIEGSTSDVKCYASASGEIDIEVGTGDISLEKLSAGSIELSTTTGRISLSSVNCSGDVEIEVDTGKASLCDVSCKNLISAGDTGDLTLERVFAREKFYIERDTGDLEFIGCDANEISVRTSTGDVSGTLLSDKIFVVNTSTGKVDVPETMSGGKCKITTSTGNVNLRIK